MPIKIKLLLLLLAACLLFEFSDSTATDDIALEKHVASTDGQEVISHNENGEIEMDRSKRLYTEKIRESLDRIKVSLEKTLAEKLESPILGSIRNSPLLKGKSRLPSLLDTYKSSFGSRGISLTPYPCPHQKLPTQETIPAKDALVGTVASMPTEILSPPSQNDALLGDAHKPVVLPDYLMDKDEQKKKKKTHPNRITMQQLKETADLRKEINYAVKQGIYVHSASEVKNMKQKIADNDPPPNIPSQYVPSSEDNLPTPPPVPQYPSFNPPAFPSFENFYNDFWQNLFGSSQKRIQEPSLGSARSDFSYVPDQKPSPDEQIVNHLPSENEPIDDGFVHGADSHSNDKAIEAMMVKAAEQMKSKGIISNTVESYANSEAAPFIEENRVREELNITSVTEDMRFNIGENVIGWRTLQRNKRESHALIGITNTSVLLVLERNGVYKLQVEKHLLSSPTFFITYTYWNETQQSIDGIVIVSIQHEIVFLRVNEAMDKMDVIWIWPTSNTARYLHHFMIDNSDTLLIITDLHGGSAASLYRFNMNEEVFFLRQSLSLKSRALNMALIQSGFNTFMCFPQKGHAVIYKYNNDHFRYFTQIESHNANILTAFEMGGYSYLAIGGSKAKILRYHRGKFQDQTILSKSWGNVEFFLPVPARTYRDDLILFVQHRMDYGSHTNSYLEALIWNGQAFHPALQVPCYINEHESELGLGCMLDEDRDLGIIGATMFQRNRSISVIVPRHEAPSGLFDLEIDLLPAVSTLNEHLLELLSEVIIMLDIREQVLGEARQLIDKFPKGPMEEVTIKNQNLDIIYTQNLDLGSLIPTDGVFVGDELITKEVVDEFSQLLNKTETNVQLLEELKRNKREESNIIEHLHLKSVNVSELNVQYINDIPSKDLIFVEDGNLKLHGTVVLNQTIKPEFVERMYDGSDQLLGQEAADMTIITGDLTFEEINGIKWKDFINQIVLKHLSNNIDNMEVLGDIIAEDRVSAQQLNFIPFPSGYILTDSNDHVIVTGKKVFNNVLVTETVETFGLFNGIQLSDVVTLNNPQYIPGTTTFRHLEVLETLELAPDAKVSGRRLDEFLANPTLQETRQIRSTVYFDTLEIDGPLYVRNTMDDVVLDDMLGDVVYKHEPDPQINSFKRFESIQAPNIHLTSNIINGIPFSSFVTTNTEQTFDVSKLRGNFYFQKLKLDGLFNFINVTELDLNSLKLLGEQFTDAEFVFADGDYLNIDANKLQVLETINGIGVRDFISIDENFELPGNVHIDSLSANELILNGELKGSPENLVNGFCLKDLVNTHLSKNAPQNITGDVFIPSVVLQNGINTEFLNGYNFKDIVNILKNIQTNEQMLNESNVVADRVFVNGSVWFRDVNGFDLEHYKANAIPLDQTNNISIPITFLDSIYVNGNINVEHLNGENFDAFSNDLVRRSADVQQVFGTTIFKEDVTIFNNAEVTTINNIQVDRILTKNYNREIFNPIRIVGDVTIPNLIVRGQLNGVSAQELNSYHHDKQNGGKFVLKKDVFFNDTIDIKFFNVHGGYENIGNVNEYLKNVIRTDRPAVITGAKTFTDTIHFEKGIDMIEFNGINVPNFLANIVLIDQVEPVDIVSDVVFAAPVVIPHMKITGNLITEMISNCSVVDWVQNTIRTDQPFDFDGVVTFPDGTFETSNINTEYLNENPMNDVITLNTEQTFDKPVKLNYVYSSVPITADGLVSGYDIPKERANTLMVYGNQNIEIPTIFNSVRVLNNLVTEGLINGRDLRLAASLQQSNIVIDSPLSFGTVFVNSLYTNDLISGINFDNWFENALVRFKPTPQYITAPWTIKNGIVSTMNVAQGINGMDANQYLQVLDQFHRQNQNDYKQKCQTAQNLIKKTQKNVIFLSHFANAFTIETQSPINSVYLLNFFDQNYFVVNSGCQTLFHVWNEQNNTYVEVSTATTGDVTEWIHVLDHGNQLFLIANNDGSIDSNCPISGAFVWRLNPMDMSLNQEVQFGQIGEFRSMQMKPNSHALFYVIRNSDSHVIEYNLKGAIVTEWNLDSAAAPPMTSSVRFVPGEAQLGLALSDGNQLSILTACNCTKRTKRCGLLTEITAMHLTGLKSEHRQNFERSMEQLRSDLDNGRTAIRNLLTSRELNQLNNNTMFSFFNQTKMENVKELIRKYKEGMTQMLSWKQTSPNSEFTTEKAFIRDKSALADKIETSTNQIIAQTEVTTPLDQPISTPVSTSDFKTVPNSIPTSSGQNKTLLAIERKFIADLVGAIDEAMAANKSFTSNSKNDQNVDDDVESVGSSGAVLVNLMDLIDKVIEENKEKHKQENSNDADYGNIYLTASQLNRTEIEQMLNDSLVLNELMSTSNTTNQTDPQVGSLFGLFMLEKTFVNTIDRASKVILGGDESESEGGERSATHDGEEKHHRRKSKNGLFGLLGSSNINFTNDAFPTHEIDSDSNLNSVDHILGLIAEADNITNSANWEQTVDPSIGDKFGDIMFKLTPVADKIMDKIVNEIRRRQYERDQNLLGSTQDVGKAHDGDKSDISSKVNGFFRKVGKSLVKVYSFGKDRFQSAKSEAKFLYNTYYNKFMEDNQNDNITNGPSKVYENEYKAREPTTDINFDKDDLRNSNSNMKKVEDQIRLMELQREMKIISMEMKNSREFTQEFAMEMIKILNDSNSAGNKQNVTFWPVIKKVVTAAFDPHLNVTHGNETEENHLIFNKFISKVNETIEHEQNKSNMSTEVMVGSVLGETTTNESKNHIMESHFDSLFNKFAPIIDVLSDKIVKKLQKQKIANENDRKRLEKESEGTTEDTTKETSTENVYETTQNPQVSNSIHTPDIKSEHRQNFERSMEQLRSDLDSGRTAIRNILTSNEVNQPGNNTMFSSSNQTKMENAKELIRKCKERMTQILSWKQTAPNVELTDQPISIPAPTSVSKPVPNSIPTSSEQNGNLLDIDRKFIADLVEAIDEAMANESLTSNPTSISNNEQKLEDDSESVGSAGGVIVNLMDLIDKLIEENKVKHKQENSNDVDYENTYRTASQLNKSEIKQMLNDSLVLSELMSISNTTNQTDPHVGTLFGMFMLEKTFANTIDRTSNVREDASDKVEKLQKQQNINESESVTEITTDDTKEQDPLTSIYEIDSDSNLDSVDHILSLIAEADNITNSVNLNQTADPSVGDKFGDIMFKLTPVADKIMDKIVNEIRQREYERDQYLLGSVQEGEGTKNGQSFPSKVIQFFRKIGQSLVSYVLGKDHVRNVHSIAKDIKHLYHVYYDELKNDKEAKEILEEIPSAKEFARSFVVEMLKVFTGKTNVDSLTKDTIWSILRNVVDAAFNLHAKNEHQNANEIESNKKVHEEFMHELNKTVEDVDHHSQEDPKEGETVGSTLSINANENQLPIEKQLSLLNRFMPLIDHLSDKMIEKLRNQQNINGSDAVTEVTSNDIEEQNPLTSTLEIDSDSNLDSVDHILSLIAEADNITNSVNLNQTADPSVGDKFGDIMFKLTPVADKIMDKIVNEIRRRQYERDQYLLGSVQDTGKADDESKNGISSKVTGFFRKVGKSLVKVYSFGKDRFRSAKNLANDAKFLYTTYYSNFMEDNQNDNITYGPTEAYENENKANEPTNDINFDKVKVKNVDQNNEKLEKQVHSIELQREMKIISKEMPNSREFAQAFAVEMIKMLSANDSGNNQNSTFWPVIRNAVTAAFELHLNVTHGNETEENHLIFNKFIGKVNETIEHEQNKSNMSTEVMVGSVLGESTTSESEDHVMDGHFDNLFNKFTPLIDVLSDKIVTKLQKQNIANENDERRLEEESERTTEDTTTKTSTENVEVKTQTSDASHDNVESNLGMENTGTKSDCHRIITMKEFEHKLNESKQTHSNADKFATIDPLRSAKETDKTPRKQEFEKKQLETTVVSIPNRSLPSHRNGEIIAIRIASSQQLMIAVSSTSEHTIKNDHDRIQIFEDVVDGKLFQTIPCYKPRSLITFNINMDTILAFIQDESEVKTFIFRGTQGFVEFTSFATPLPIKQMIHNEIVTHPSQFMCPEHFLILVIGNQVDFMRAVTIGDCRINEQLNC